MNASNVSHRILALGLSTLVLAGCAGADVQPSGELAQAETSIRQAEQSGAAEHSARELNLAREKLTQAQDAVREENFVLAQRLAQQASADAELAAALARSSEAETAAEEIEATIATLRAEASPQ
jgi:hypothetical protein